MNSLRAVIAEDEDLMRAHLRSLISGLSQSVTIVAEAADGGAAVEAVEKHQPDLLFLDVQMPVLDGFGVIEKLMLSGHVPEIIFTTAYDRYALRAFELNAAHYLLKPISAERLAAAVERAAERIETRKPASSPEAPGDLQAHEEALHKLFEAFQAQMPRPPSPPRLSGLTSKVRDKIVVIPLDDIFHISAEGGLNFIHTAREKFLTDFTLDELEKRLDPDRFLRIYRSHLVNLSHIKALVPWTEGRFEVILNDEAETRLHLSRYRLPEIRARLPW